MKHSSRGLVFLILLSSFCLLLTGCWSDYWGKKHFWNPQGRIEVFQTISPVTNAFTSTNLAIKPAPAAAAVTPFVRTNVNLSVRWTPAPDSGGYRVDSYDVIITVREHTQVGWGPRAVEAHYQVK